MPEAESATCDALGTQRPLRPSVWPPVSFAGAQVLTLTPSTERPRLCPQEGQKLTILIGLDVIFLIRLEDLEQEKLSFLLLPPLPTASSLSVLGAAQQTSEVGRV